MGLLPATEFYGSWDVYTLVNTGTATAPIVSLAANAAPLLTNVGLEAGADPSISGNVGQSFTGGGIDPLIYSSDPQGHGIPLVTYFGEYMLGSTTIYIVTDGVGKYWMFVGRGGDVSAGAAPSALVADGDQLANTWFFDNTCFAAGTMLATPDCERAVETLKIGDLVLTAHNGPREIVWIGKGKIAATRGQRGPTTPVIVRKGALGDNVPNRDLHVTKAHGLYIDDVIIPVEFLINHRSILWNELVQEVEIYHIELDTHDVLIANGAPAESYRDDGNRSLFQNANSGWHLPPKAPFAPVLTGGPIVDAAWKRLIDRAGPRVVPALTEDPDLHLIVDGQRIAPKERKGATYTFRLPINPTSVAIASRAADLAKLGIARDPRLLGVAFRKIELRQGAKFMLLTANDDRLTDGFHSYEPADNLRWTDGHAKLPVEAFARFDRGAEVRLYLGGTTKYPADSLSTAGAIDDHGPITLASRFMPAVRTSQSPFGGRPFTVRMPPTAGAVSGM